MVLKVNDYESWKRMKNVELGGRSGVTLVCFVGPEGPHKSKRKSLSKK